MRTLATLALGVVIGAIAAVFVMLLLDDDSVARADPVSTGGLSTYCVALIPDSVFKALGWRLGGFADENAGRCERYGDDGGVTVGDLAVVASGDQLAAAAEQVYDERCSTLVDVDATPDLDLDWLPEGTTACARLLPSGQVQGVAELFLLTDDHEVVQIRLVALSPTGQSAVQLALAQLIESAEARF